MSILKGSRFYRAGPYRVSKKWLKTTFSSFLRVLPLAFRSRAAKPAECENLRFSSVLTHMSSKPEYNSRGCGPLTTPRFFDRLKGLRFLGGAP